MTRRIALVKEFGNLDVKEVVLPPRKIIKEGPNYKIYIPASIVEMFNLKGKKVEVTIRIAD